MNYIEGGVCAARGFRAAGMHVGVKTHNTSKKDVTLIVSDVDCAAAAVFTKNVVKAAPIHDLGMASTYLGPTGSQIGAKESIADTARVLGRMFDGIEYRGFGQTVVEELAANAGVPVFNGLTNEFHPTQILADFLTVQEHFGSLKGVKLVYMGDARYNMGLGLTEVSSRRRVPLPPHMLKKQGVFKVRNSVNVAANFFHLSEPTIYRYLQKAL